MKETADTIDAAAAAKCAQCGKGGGGLKMCVACKIVKYCGAECQKKHRQEHKMECKKRAAELYDKLLFKEPVNEDCPTCCIPPVHGLMPRHRALTCR